MGNRPGADGGRFGDGDRASQRPSNPQDRRDNLQDRLSSRDENRGDLQDNRDENRGDRQDNRGDRQDNRDENRGDRQENRDEAREDWHDRYDDLYHNHDDWHHGHWHGDYGDWWHHMWDDHTALMAFGTTMWGINRAAYAFGYWGYDNPYYYESYPVGGDVMIDYSEPIILESAPIVETAAPIETTVVVDSGAVGASSSAPAPGMSDFDAAREAFYRGDYSAALASTNKALAAMPNDPIIHEFRALVMFAQGKYKDAAAGLYGVLSVGPGWDWTTLSSLYPSVDTYTKQLRALEQYVKQYPRSSDARFVLMYHYLTTNNVSSAAAQLKELHKQTPSDPLIKQLLVMTAGPEAVGGAPVASNTEQPQAPAIPPADLVGKWSAAGQGDSKFGLELTKDGNFSWTFTEKGKPQTVKGVYAMDGNVLAMEPESGGVMLAELSPPDSGRFNFQLLGAPPGDPGLKFAKSQT